MFQKKEKVMTEKIINTALYVWLLASFLTGGKIKLPPKKA